MMGLIERGWQEASAASAHDLGFMLAKRIAGTSRSDDLEGTKGNDVISGLGGNDTIFDDRGNDRLYGNAGNDTLTGGSGNDILDGGTGNDELIGEIGNDILYGGAGNDRLAGHEGLNTLYGGPGRDKFIFEFEQGRPDKIMDFKASDDTIMLDRGFFEAVQKGTLSSGAFQLGSQASEADDRIIYNQATGAISYDPDGNVAQGARIFAYNVTKSAMTYADFVGI